jgi:hypothetical protein
LKRRRVSAVALGLGAAGLVAWRAHRAAARAVAGVMLVEAVPELPGVGPEPPAGAPQGWDGLVSRINFDPQWDFQFGAPQFADLTDAAVNAVRTDWSTFRAFIGIEFDAVSTVFGFFDSIWGTAGDFVGDFIQGAAQEAARILGLATGEQVYQLAGYTRAALGKLGDGINDLAHKVETLVNWSQWVTDTLNDLGATVWRVWENTQSAIRQLETQINATIAEVEAALRSIAGDVAALPNEIPQLDPGVIVPQITTIVETELPQQIVNVLPLVFPVIVGQVAAQLPHDLAQLDPDAARRLADDEACCAANAATGDDLARRLKQLEDLLKALGIGLGLLSAQDIIDKVAGFLSGDAEAVADTLGKWLSGDVDPADLAGMLF